MNNEPIIKAQRELETYAFGVPDLLYASSVNAIINEGSVTISPAMSVAIADELNRLRQVILRLGSNEAFDRPTSVISKELDSRMSFARAALLSTKGAPTFVDELDS